jgi:hypothetical protein
MTMINALVGGSSATIYPCRFVSVDPTNSPAGSGGFKVIEDIVVAQAIVGVSQVGTNSFPMAATNDMSVTASTAAGTTGQQIGVFGMGEECLIELGGTVAPGDLLKANATTDGKAIVVTAVATTTTPQFVGGIALQGGASGEFIRMLVQPQVITQHA